jgi:L-alanine-DL-glutamate epimerase-like enolase superfamily enzyme
MIDHAGIGFVQIDVGRIGGITPARRVAQHADARGVTFVNHTFTSHLALSASLQPYAGLERHELCEYPVEARPLAVELTDRRLERDADGRVHLPQAPGLGLAPDLRAVRKYLVDAEISVGGRVLYRTPALA